MEPKPGNFLYKPTYKQRASMPMMISDADDNNDNEIKTIITMMVSMVRILMTMLVLIDDKRG